MAPTKSPALGNTETSRPLDPSAPRRDRDRAQETIRQLNRRLFGPRLCEDGHEWVQEHAFGSCGQPLGDRVAAGIGETVNGERRGRFAGVETCKSASACLRCGCKISAERAADIGRVLKAHLAGGGHALFLTVTLSHSLDDTAGDVLDDVRTAWSAMTGKRRWKKLMAWLGGGRFVRVLEVTRSDANGWHPHFHVALLTDRPVGLDENDPLEVEDFRQEIDAQWSLAVGTLGREVHPDIGVDLTPIRDAAGIGRYVSKISLEMARSDLKRGRGGSRSPWQIALDAAAGDPQSTALWVEWCEAAKGARFLSTSRGLWAEFGIETRTDDEIAEDDDGGIDDLVVMVDRPVYTAAAKAPGQVLTELRHLIEARASAAVLAIVLARRLGRPIEIQHHPDDDGTPTLAFPTATTRRDTMPAHPPAQAIEEDAQ